MIRKGKLLSVALVMALVMGMTGCGSAGAPASNDNATVAEAPSVEEKTEETVEQAEADSKDEVKEEEKTEEAVEETSDAEDRSAEALEFAKNLKLGWNLGNTFDAFIDEKGFMNTVNTETCWGNPKACQELFDGLKATGFTSVRIPVSWHNHLTLSEPDENGVEHLIIDEDWLKRVKEVVDYAYNADLYVIINIHHDNIPVDKFGYIPDYENEEQALWYIEEIWSTVAPYFEEYDNHLIFEGLNEPRLTNDPSHEWNIDVFNAHCKEAADVINKMNQIFVDTVRATGGNNGDRYLIVTGYCASPNGVDNALFKLPDDTVSGRLMVSLHAYVPYEFALSEDMTNRDFDPEDKRLTESIAWVMRVAKLRLTTQGIPAVLDEFGCRDKNGNDEARIAYYKYYVNKCYENDMPCFVWDNGVTSGSGEIFGIINRKDGSALNEAIVDAIISSWPEE